MTNGSIDIIQLKYLILVDLKGFIPFDEIDLFFIEISLQGRRPLFSYSPDLKTFFILMRILSVLISASHPQET